ncbi:MAG: enoyl-CoA hydratase-related protein [Dehalococcoidia bacterium]|nr:enoyl-CoA hydratase-related protein [Dehalococcoidia bacterium]
MPPLLFEKRDGIAYVTFNRPEARNAWDPETMVRLADAWRDFAGDDSLRVAIVTGTGDKAFSAGADLNLLIPLFTRAREAQDEWDWRVVKERGLHNTTLMRGFPVYKPVIAAVNGACLAGGAELLWATDIRIAAEHATFGLSEAKRALVPGGGSLVRLARQIPYAKAMELLLTGDPITAQEAYRIGLVNYVVPADEVMPLAERFARTLAENGPLAVRKIKEAVIRTSGLPLEDAYKIESECSMEVTRSEDAKEGPRAFMEKRKANYLGR